MLSGKKKYFGFTLIELLVTVSIIVLMALVAVPTFSTYQKRSQFVQTTSEVSGLINQYALMAKNPELGVGCYRITGSLVFSKHVDCLIDTPALPNPKSFDNQYFGDDSTIDLTESLRCETKSGDCFLDARTATTGIKTTILTIKDNRVKKSAEYKVTDKPFSVELEINDVQ